MVVAYYIPSVIFLEDLEMCILFGIIMIYELRLS